MDTFSDLAEKLFCFTNIGWETIDINNVGGLEKVNTWKAMIRPYDYGTYKTYYELQMICYRILG